MTAGDQSSDAGSRRPEPDTSGLVSRARSGDGAGFEDLYRRLAPAVHAWAQMRLPPDGSAGFEATDVVQETWMVAWRRFADFDPLRGSFRGWLFGVANNVLLGLLRRGVRTRVAATEPVDHPSDTAASVDAFALATAHATTVSRAVARDEDLARLIDRLLALDSEDRSAILYLGFEGLSARAAAPLMGTTPAAAEKRWQRLRARLLAMPEILPLIEPA